MRKLSLENLDLIREVVLAQLSPYPENMLEKDWHNSIVLDAIASHKNDLGIEPIFAGGTSLSKAHNLINRMSEDLDFRLGDFGEASRSQNKKARRNFHNRLQKILTDEGYEVVAREPHNEYKSLKFSLKYDAAFLGVGNLRSEIQIDVWSAPLQLLPEIRQPRNLALEAAGFSYDSFNWQCMQPAEILIEKIISLTRRAEDINGAGWEPQLLRHIYDVHSLVSSFEPNIESLIPTAKNLLDLEIKTRTKSESLFAIDPKRAMRQNIEKLKDQKFVEDYVSFTQSMAVGMAPDYQTALATFSRTAETLFA